MTTSPVNQGNNYTTIAGTIPISTDTSTTYQIGGAKLGGVFIPASMTSTTLGIEVYNAERETWFAAIAEDGTAIEITCSTAGFVPFDASAALLSAAGLIRFTGSATETAEREIDLQLVR